MAYCVRAQVPGFTYWAETLWVCDFGQGPQLLCLGFLISKMGWLPALKVSYEK